MAQAGLMKKIGDSSILGLCGRDIFVALEYLDHGNTQEIHMDASRHGGQKPEYTTSHRIQAWFLQRSRDNWKKKYMQLKSDAKRLQNRVSDVTKSREQWREETQQQAQRIQELEAENAALHEQLAALKKDGLLPAAGSAP